MPIVIDDQTPESIAERIFNNKPAPMKSYEILPDLEDNYDDLYDDDDINIIIVSCKFTPRIDNYTTVVNGAI